MDLADLKRKAEAAREFAVPLDGKQFTLRLPTKHELDVELVRANLHEGGTDPAVMVRLKRQLLVRSLVGWSEVVLNDLAPGGGAEVATLVPGAASLLFDARPDIEDALYLRYLEEREARNKKQDTAEKN